MKKDLKELKKFLEDEREDCLKLEVENDLTLEGKGMLVMINIIFEKMNWGKK